MLWYCIRPAPYRPATSGTLSKPGECSSSSQALRMERVAAAGVTAGIRQDRSAERTYAIQLELAPDPGWLFCHCVAATRKSRREIIRAAAMEHSAAGTLNDDQPPRVICCRANQASGPASQSLEQPALDGDGQFAVGDVHWSPSVHRDVVRVGDNRQPRSTLAIPGHRGQAVADRQTVVPTVLPLRRRDLLNTADMRAAVCASTVQHFAWRTGETAVARRPWQPSPTARSPLIALCISSTGTSARRPKAP